MNGLSKPSMSRVLPAGLLLLPSTLLLAAALAQQSQTFEIDDFGVVPRPSLMRVLLSMESVQQELQLTEDQKKEQEAIFVSARQKLQQARRDVKNQTDFLQSRDAILKQISEPYLAIFKPAQRQRLDQIQLQAQGPLAFVRPAAEASALIYVGPPLAERLKLSKDQLERIRKIEQAGEAEITQAASFPIIIDSKEKPTLESVSKLVDSPEFQAAKKKAAQTGRDATAAVIRRIKAVLNDSQREAYHKLLGPPFDLSRLRWAGESDHQNDLATAAQALGIGGGGGQQADPDFDTKVAHPAYAGGPRHPRVLFDEAHHNFHTAGGRYMPFAKLMTSDGYLVIPNREKFSREVLARGDILVIANALGAEGMGQPGAANPAFTDAECAAVRDWIEQGGGLLFIADHAPMGSAAQCLAKRLGVSMSTGATSDPANSSGGDTWLVFSRANHLLADHPITRGRDRSEQVNKVQTFTGTSLKGPEGATPILKLADTAVDMSMDEGGSKSAAGRAQGIAFPLRKGRVVVMGEAAELSAQVSGSEKFGMNAPGIDNRQMALNIMHWLSGLLEPRQVQTKKAG